jgi:mRNA interferase RelE/StbE
MFTIRFSKSADKAMQKLPKGVAVRMFAELRAIAADPSAYRGDWKPLQGADKYWRLRVGAWRAICELRVGELVLLVVKVAARGDVYK